MLRNGDFTAFFSWPRYWEAQVPERVVLERMSGPDGPIVLSDSTAYLDALKKHFPDAFPRIIESMKVIDD